MKRPKPRIKKVFKEALENIGKPMGEILRENGYSDNTADNPKLVTETKSWEMLLEKYLDDEKLARVADEGLGATTILDKPDYPTRRQYLETALKMKGKITEKKDITSGGKPIPLLGNVPDNLGS